MISNDEVRKFLTMPTKNKKAITKGWNKLTKSLRIEEGYNTAIITGKKSNITVLDIDIPDKGETDGRELIKMFGLDNCYTVETPSGGLHIYFNYVKGIKNMVKISIDNKTYSADIRNNNGYILAPPSKDYKLIKDLEILNMPKSLIDALISPTINHKQSAEPNSKVDELWKIFSKRNPQEAKNFKPSTMKNDILNTIRLYPSYCDICDRTHDNDNTLYLTIKEKTRLFRGCIRKSALKFVFDSDIKKKYKVELPKKEQIEAKRITDQDMMKSASDKFYIVSTRWLSDCKRLMKRFTNSNTEGITAVKSEKGTGKTYTLAQEWKKAKHKNSRIQILTFRVSLANNMTLEFGGFKHYQEHDKLSINDKNIICLDSLYKLDQRKQPGDKCINDILYLDEISQIRLHTTSKTYLRQPRFEQNRKALINLIKFSRHIIITDANITSADINYINEIRGENKGLTYTFHNEFIDTDKKRTFQNMKKSEIINNIITDIKAKKPAYLATNGSVDSINELERQIILTTQINQSDILTIHSRNQNQDPQRKFILDPNSELKQNKYLLIITSPCIQSGFNISLKKYINNIYGIFGNSTNSPNDADQMLGRVRNPINKIINYSFKYTNRSIGPTNETDYKKHIIANAHSRIDEMNEALYGRLEGDYNESGEYEIFNNSLLKSICKNKAHENRQLLRWHESFIMRQLIAGHQVFLDSVTKNQDLKTVKISAIQAKQEIKEEKAELLNTVKPATDDEIKAFKLLVTAGESLSILQQAQQEKAFLLNTYGIDHKEAPKDNDWYFEYNNKKYMKAYRIQKKVFSITEKNNNLQKALDNIKISDINRLKGQDLGGDPKELMQRTADLATANLQSAKLELLFEWLAIFGISNNLYTRNLVEDDIYKALNKIHKDYLTHSLSETVDILGKNKKRTASLATITPSDKGFIKKILEFINGSLNELLGVKIKNISRCHKKREYQFKNNYLDDGIFTMQNTDSRPHYCDIEEINEICGSCDELEF